MSVKAPVPDGLGGRNAIGCMGCVAVLTYAEIDALCLWSVQRPAVAQASDARCRYLGPAVGVLGTIPSPSTLGRDPCAGPAFFRRRVKSNIEVEKYPDMAHPAMTSKLDFAIIGAQKSASSFLHVLLRSHPAIAMPAGESACFETPDFEQGNVISQVGALLADTEPSRKVGIKRPSYLTRFEVPSRLAEHNRDMRLVAVLRNPIDRFVSAYFHNMNLSMLPVSEINTAVHSIFQGDYLSRVPLAYQLLHYGLYSEGIKNFLGHFDREQLLLIDHRKVSKNPQEAFDVICRHLGVPAVNAEAATLAQRPKTTLYSYRYARICRPGNALRFSYSSGRMRLQPRRARPVRLSGLLVERFARKLASTDRINERRVLTNDSKRLLADYYRHSVDELTTYLPSAGSWLSE